MTDTHDTTTAPAVPRRRTKPTWAALKSAFPDAYAAIKPRAPVLSNELRALQVLAAVPAGCTAHLDAYSMCSPHVRSGELAVADTGDREVRNGEIYMMRYDGALGEARFSILQARLSVHGWWLGPMRTSETAACSDGPYSDTAKGRAFLQSKVVGRVIGVLATGAGR